MKSRNPTEGAISRWIAKGFGQGCGLTYKPFFYVRDIPSDGRSTILEGLKIPRTHHYFSDVEYHYHLLAEFSDSVTEIRERFALLPREETQVIAERLGIGHPVYSVTGIQRVLTSDLVLTVRKGDRITLLAISCKRASDIAPDNPKSARTLEKAILEKVYWEARNVEWRLVTEKMLPENRVHNLDFFRGTMVSREKDHLNPRMPAFLATARAVWDDCISLNDFLATTSARLGIEDDDSFCLLGRAVWSKALPADLDSNKFSHEGQLPSLLSQEFP